MAPIKIRFRQETRPRKMLKKNRKNVHTWNRRLKTNETGLLKNNGQKINNRQKKRPKMKAANDLSGA